ncbi:MAG: hypothetical protein ACK5YO_16645, partial [Planctomyces sp.]
MWACVWGIRLAETVEFLVVESQRAGCSGVICEGGVMGILLGLGFLGAFLLAVVMTPLVRRAAPALGLIDLPGDRKVHVVPTPRGGGIAIFLGVLIPALILPAAGVLAGVESSPG